MLVGGGEGGRILLSIVLFFLNNFDIVLVRLFFNHFLNHMFGGFVWFQLSCLFYSFSLNFQKRDINM